MAETAAFILGSSSDTITWWQVTARAVLVFAYGMLLVRMGAGRLFGKNAALDIVLAVLLGSLMSRTITGDSPLVGTLLAATVLVYLHMGLAWLSIRFPAISNVIKGDCRRLVTDGEIDWPQMRVAKVGEQDLMEALRLNGIGDVRDVEAAYLERGGKISAVARPGAVRSSPQ